MNNAKAKFTIEAGALMRSKVRATLNRVKSKIEFNNELASVKIIESKGFLCSEFIFQAIGLTDNEAIAVESYYYSLKNIMEN